MSTEKDTVLIMRGPSGSGKSSFVDKFLVDLGRLDRESAYGWQVCSADEFFWDTEEKVYKFDPYKLGQAHSACFRKYLGLLVNREPVIVVDNTNVHWWEFQNYVWALAMLAKEYKLIIVSCQPTKVTAMKEFADRQIHGVDPGIVAKQVIEFEELRSFRDTMPVSVDYQVFTAESYWRNQRDINQ